MPDKQSVFFVDDEQPMRHAVGQWLSVAGYRVETFEHASKARDALSRDFDGILVSDLRMPGTDGMALLEQALAIDGDIPVILMTGQGDVESAVTAMRIGAYDFIEKPFDPERFAQTVHRASEKRRLVLENRRLSHAGSNSDLRNRILGSSREIERLREDVAEVAKSDVSVVLYGETGSGKDLVARALHDFGERARGHYVVLNCAAIPETMVESELFGHEAGAFTGAAAKRVGKLEFASGGTLFLDEVESMPLPMQAKLLRVLQERSLERLGSNRSINVDLRTIAASKADLNAAGETRDFRPDLYFRLSVVELHIPPLRQRRDDIPLLFEFFAVEAARNHNREVRPVKGAILDALVSRGWPGNVRELRNVAERHALGLGTIALPGETASPSTTPHAPLSRQMEAFERRIIERTLADCGGRITDVMERLDIPRRTLNEKMNRLGINRREPSNSNRQ